jgi:hypothetical protein
LNRYLKINDVLTEIPVITIFFILFQIPIFLELLVPIHHHAFCKYLQFWFESMMFLQDKKAISDGDGVVELGEKGSQGIDKASKVDKTL